MRLPPELIDHIFSFLRKDTPALKACSAAHPLYSRLAEPYLYANIVVVVETPKATKLHEQLTENSHLLNYPRVLNIHYGFDFILNPRLGLSIISMIPRMTNLRSLSIHRPPCPFDHFDEFISTTRDCLQQSSIEQIYLAHIHQFPLSALDNCKNIKKLTLIDCMVAEEPISSSTSSHQTLRTLTICEYYDRDVYFWARGQVTCLTSLGLRELPWDQIPDLLSACSNSLTNLHLGTPSDFSTTYYLYYADRQGDHWVDDDQELPFTLSPLVHLKSLSVFGMIESSDGRFDCALPDIIRLINTAPAVEHVVLSLHCLVTSCTSLGQLDWSILDRLKCNSTGTRPRIEFCITVEGIVGPSFSPESVLEALAGSDVLMNMVKEGSINLKTERALALWDE